MSGTSAALPTFAKLDRVVDRFGSIPMAFVLAGIAAWLVSPFVYPRVLNWVGLVLVLTGMVSALTLLAISDVAEWLAERR